MAETLKMESTLASRLADLRFTLHLTLQDVADRAGLSKSFVWDLENGKQDNPSLNTIVALAGLFGVSVQYLATGEMAGAFFHRSYPCGLEAQGGTPLPKLCPEHGASCSRPGNQGQPESAPLAHEIVGSRESFPSDVGAKPLISEVSEEVACLYRGPLSDAGILAVRRGDLLRRCLAAMSAAPPAQPHPSQAWRCFHCDEVFTDEAEARLHFGVDAGEFGDYPIAACKLTPEEVREIRELEAANVELRRDNERLEHYESMYLNDRAARQRLIKGRERHQELDFREGEKLVLEEKVAKLEAQLAAQPHPETPQGEEADRLQPIERGDSDRPQPVSRCGGRYTVPHKRSEPFPVTYRCGLQEGHTGEHGAKASQPPPEALSALSQKWRNTADICVTIANRESTDLRSRAELRIQASVSRTHADELDALSAPPAGVGHEGST